MRISRIESTKTIDVQDDEVDLSLLNPIIEKHKNKLDEIVEMVYPTLCKGTEKCSLQNI